MECGVRSGAEGRGGELSPEGQESWPVLHVVDREGQTAGTNWLTGAVPRADPGHLPSRAIHTEHSHGVEGRHRLSVRTRSTTLRQ